MLVQEHAHLSEIKEAWQRLESLEKRRSDNEVLLERETDPEFLAIVREELKALESETIAAKHSLDQLLIPPDPKDHRSIILEIRAGTGGAEAALFVADCVRMYQLYAAKKGWKWEVLSETYSDLGGFKDYVVAISGHNVYRLMQYEAGTHRVQRIPKTETQGRIHTSAVTVAVLLEPDEQEKIVLDPKDLKIDTYRSSGAGGQHVNVTDSAVRITHLPTGITASCQEERSQHKNKEKAMRHLMTVLAEEKRKKEEQERGALRAAQIGTGDRSERIRTYNFPQNRVTDHRIHLTLHKLDSIMSGDLDALTEALVQHFRHKV